MPTKTTSNKPKNKRSNLQKARPKAPAPKKISTSKYIFIGLAALVVLGGLMWWLPKKGEVMDIQKSMETYLEDKYDKDFVVGEPKLTGAGLAVTGSWRAEAYPLDDKSLVFEVGRVQEEERFFDNYTSIVWEREERPRVEMFLKNLSPPLPYQKIYLNTNLKSAQNPNPIRGNVPTIDEAMKQYGDQFNYSLGIKLSVKTLKDERTKSDIRSQFYALNEFIKSRKLSSVKSQHWFEES